MYLHHLGIFATLYVVWLLAHKAYARAFRWMSDTSWFRLAPWVHDLMEGLWVWTCLLIVCLTLDAYVARFGTEGVDGGEQSCDVSQGCWSDDKRQLDTRNPTRPDSEVSSGDVA